MKVKSILKLSSATKLRILEPHTDGCLIDHTIDYANGPLEPEIMSEHWIKYGTIAGVPERVLDADVKLITGEGLSALTIYTK